MNISFPLLQLQCIIPILLIFAPKLSGCNQGPYQKLYDYTLSEGRREGRKEGDKEGKKGGGNASIALVYQKGRKTVHGYIKIQNI